MQYRGDIRDGTIKWGNGWLQTPVNEKTTKGVAKGRMTQENIKIERRLKHLSRKTKRGREGFLASQWKH